jgi:hypothetical protein
MYKDPDLINTTIKDPDLINTTILLLISAQVAESWRRYEALNVFAESNNI